MRFENPDGHASLAGTLTIPEGASKKTPVMVLVSGSGQQNRDEEIFDHKPFAVIADYLARNGVASLRYDDRGVGGSTGEVAQATTADFAGDARAAIDWLRASKRFGKVGIIGHSEGGQIAYMLGAQKKGPDFIVSIAGPTIKGTKTIAFQNKELLLGNNVSEPDAEAFAVAIEKILEMKLENPALNEMSDETIAEIYPPKGATASQLAEILKKLPASQKTFTPWYVYFLGYDPQADVSKLRVPAMLIFGEKDKQVPATLNEPLARKYAPHATVRTYPGLNHLMQHATTGAIDEYGTIEETFAPEVLADILAFIQSL